MQSGATLPIPTLILGLAATMSLCAGASPSAIDGGRSSAQDDDGFVPLIASHDGRYHKAGWKHHGPGYFALDPDTGVLESHGGMGLFVYAEQEFSDFILELEFKTSKRDSNSGVFLRLPEVPSSNEYIRHSFEVQIDDGARKGVHRTGAIYDAEPASRLAARPTGQWNHYRITFIGNHLTVELNGEVVVDWDAEPRGKVRDFASRGYVGLQNHDHDSSVWFRNIRVKDLSDGS